jgi:hypothetical protein
MENGGILEWRNGKTCCHACFTEYGKIEICLKNWLYVHYRSLHRRSDFSEETTVKKGVELLQDLVATETFNKAFQYEAINRLGCCSCSGLYGLSWCLHAWNTTSAWLSISQIQADFYKNWIPFDIINKLLFTNWNINHRWHDISDIYASFLY